ncbi:glycosyltransferase family 4 protein [Flavimarina sp. Hel_I_48]|uniref:glycosyltransferase family 4 protein n=1 Tax=Flavimarina sp. Hel_I_48 TaxID=1392488 RepID=UPI0013DA5FAF|nr:MraY family glycosyltransferase [Flavimarina sp. Hel_I_48]
MIPIVFVILAFSTAFIISIITLPEIIKVIMGREVFDTPGGRKLHVGNIPTMGGAAIFVGFILSALVWVPMENLGTFKYLFFALILLAFTGIRDDMVALSSLNKFIVQLLAACVVVGLGGVSINSFYTFGIDFAFPEWLSFAISVFVIVGLTNSFNLVDGIDGLAASIALVCILFLGVWFYMTGFTNLALVCGAMCGAVLAFICFNWHPAKIFMGDTGSLFVGFFCAVVLIIFLNKNQELPSTEILKIKNSVSLAMVLFIYPIFDTSRIMLIRLSQRRSPFAPDKLHIHSLLLRLGLKHHQISIIVGVSSVLGILLCLILDNYVLDSIAVLIGFLCCLIISFTISKRVKKFKSNRKTIIIKKAK